MPKHALRIVKKKITPKSILYKIEWSNGCISYEPFTEIGPDLLPLIQAFELNSSKGGSDKPTNDNKEKEKERDKDKEREREREKEKEREHREKEKGDGGPPAKSRKQISDDDSPLRKKPQDDEPKRSKKIKKPQEVNLIESDKDDEPIPTIKEKESKNKNQNSQNNDQAGDEIQGHQPRQSLACTIRQLRRMSQLNNNLEFLVSFQNEAKEVWMNQTEMRQKAPVALCEYLLGKVKWNKQ